MEPKNGTQSIVDLAERHSQDLDVLLMWGTRSGRLWVRVTHRASGRTARIEASAWNALDVFNHPFAYAGGAVMQSYEAPILIGYDGSPAAVRAIETALLGPRRAVVLAVASSMTVAESFAAPYSAMAGAAVEESYTAEASRIADEGTEIARSSGFDAVARGTRAVPTWEGIVEIADELDAPVIVVEELIKTHSHGGEQS